MYAEEGAEVSTSIRGCRLPAAALTDHLEV